MSFLPDEHLDSLLIYIRAVADRMGLKDWSIYLAEKPSDVEFQHAKGSCECVYGRRVATIALCHNFLELEPESQRHVIIHELLHCHFSQPWNFAEAEMSDGRFNGWRLMAENAIDGVATAWAEWFPIWAAPKAKRAVKSTRGAKKRTRK